MLCTPRLSRRYVLDVPKQISRMIHYSDGNAIDNQVCSSLFLNMYTNLNTMFIRLCAQNQRPTHLVNNGFHAI